MLADAANTAAPPPSARAALYPVVVDAPTTAKPRPEVAFMESPMLCDSASISPMPLATVDVTAASAPQAAAAAPSSAFGVGSASQLELPSMSTASSDGESPQFFLPPVVAAVPPPQPRHPNQPHPLPTPPPPPPSYSEHDYPPLSHAVHAVAVLERAMPAHDPPGSRITAFHSSAAPAVPLDQYVQRIVYHSGYGAEGVCNGLALLARYCAATGRLPTVITAHRLLAACIVVGMKATSDCFVKNKYMAPITGVPLAELNWLEAQLLDAIHFSAIPTAREALGVPASLLRLEHEVKRIAEAHYQQASLQHHHHHHHNHHHHSSSAFLRQQATRLLEDALMDRNARS